MIEEILEALWGVLGAIVAVATAAGIVFLLAIIAAMGWAVGTP